MTTKFSAITAAIVTALEEDPPVSPQIFRARERQVPESMVTAINVQYDGGEAQAGAIQGAPVDWTSMYSVECYARAATGQAPDEAVDPLIDGVYRRIMADTTLGGLVDDVLPPRIETEYTNEGQKTGWVRMSFPVLHRTENLTIS